MGKDLNINDVIALLNKNQNNRAEYLSPTIRRSKYTNVPLTFSDSAVELILDKIFSKCDFLLSKSEVSQGIVPNPDIVSQDTLSKIPDYKVQKYDISVGNPVFVIPKGFFPNLSAKEQNYIKPLYEPIDLNRYYLPEKSSKDIIYLTKENWKPNLKTLTNHLSKYREIMDARRENQNGKRDFYHLHWPRKKILFQDGAKILSVRKCERPTFVYTDSETYVMMAINIIISKRINLKYLTGILNSKTILFWLKHKGKLQGHQFQVDKEPLLALPLISPPSEKQIPIVTLVDKILAAKRADPNANTSNPEDKIDKLVYALYDLTDDEIAIVEGSA